MDFGFSFFNSGFRIYFLGALLHYFNYKSSYSWYCRYWTKFSTRLLRINFFWSCSFFWIRWLCYRNTIFSCFELRTNIQLAFCHFWQFWNVVNLANSNIIKCVFSSNYWLIITENYRCLLYNDNPCICSNVILFCN